MSAIKDIIDLARDLESRAKDRRDIEVLRQIHSLAFSLQAEHADVVERDVRLMQENAELKQKTTALELRVAEAEQRVARERAESEQFVEHRGALFKRKPGGGFHAAVYCPSCRTSASSVEGHFSYQCRCGWFGDFTGTQLQSILKELPS